jgi:hypothetical protein
VPGSAAGNTDAEVLSPLGPTRTLVTDSVQQPLHDARRPTTGKRRMWVGSLMRLTRLLLLEAMALGQCSGGLLQTAMSRRAVESVSLGLWTQRDCSRHDLAAGDIKRDAGDPGCAVGCQEENGAGDILWCTRGARGDASRSSALCVLQGSLSPAAR